MKNFCKNVSIFWNNFCVYICLLTCFCVYICLLTCFCGYICLLTCFCVYICLLTCFCAYVCLLTYFCVYICLLTCFCVYICLLTCFCVIQTINFLKNFLSVYNIMRKQFDWIRDSLNSFYVGMISVFINSFQNLIRNISRNAFTAMICRKIETDYYVREKSIHSIGCLIITVYNFIVLYQSCSFGW